MRGKTYFASDFHLGVDARLSSREREEQIVRWLDSIATDAEAIYLVGDVFDYWFEYQSVVPKGYVRLLGKLAELRSRDIPIYFFTGNHDMWMFKYLEEELDIPIYRNPVVREISGKTFLIGHGDGLGPGDHGYKFIKRIFNNRVCQWLYGHLIHPDLAWRIARFWSKQSRGSGMSDQVFLGPEREWLIQYANEEIDKQAIDYFVFGHRHLPIDYTLKNGKSRYINLGEWLTHNSYAVFDGADLQIKFFENESGRVYPVND
ncbi:MAG: UDP-2,3-diacylglucosamine diphosphatase [Bacteroidetes bacterium]|nr:UDP-2,3-diacylglucosamine diphosphatase [Bacteroidota bacterium]